MIALTILGCSIMCCFFLITTFIIKGISSVFDTMFDLLAVWAILLLGGAVIFVIEFLVAIFGIDFWELVWTVVAIVFILSILGAAIGAVGSILLLVFEVAIYVVGIVFNLLDVALEILGNLCEKGLKFFLGTINQKIVLS